MPANILDEVAASLAALLRRDLARLTQQIRAFPEDAALWQTLPGVSNCAGNLILHLEGNLREYVGRRFGGIPYERNRPAEFTETGLSRAELARRIESLQQIIPEAVERITGDQWSSECGDMLPGGRSMGQALLSLYGHFHYHLGQIDYLRRIVTNGSAVSFAQLER